MLKVQELQVNYGGIRAVKNISFEVPDGSIVTLVGANGAGKSTTLRTIAGQVKAQAGSITYNGEELLGKPSDEIVKRGITLVPEGRRVFPDMTVLENMKQHGYYTDQSRSYLLQLIDITPTAANVKEYIDIIKDKTLLRRSATGSWPGPFPAASSRCWPWPAP